MPQFRATILSAALATCLAGAVAVPTAVNAQAWRHAWTPHKAAVIRNQINHLATDINRARTRRTISVQESRGLHQALRSLRYQFRTYNRDGLNAREVRYLQNRANRIRMRLRLERFDWDRRRW
jgi:hypothetical protein